MSTSRYSLASKLLLAFAGVNSLALLIASVALLVWVSTSEDRYEPAPPSDGPAVAASDSVKPARTGKRFTLRLGQGFRFKDGAVVVTKEGETSDIVFKYLPPQVGGMALRYNEISQQVETGLEPTLTSPVPLLVGTHIQPFDQKPDVARITSGDAATYGGNAPITSTTRFVLLMNPAGDQYLLTLDELEAVPGKYDEWRIGFAYEKIELPVGLAGGRINKPLPGKLIFRDWYRSKVIVRVDLTSGKEDPLVDGILPTAVGNGVMGYGDTSGAYVVRDAAGKTLSMTRFNEELTGPVLSPDGTRLLALASRAGPDFDYGGGITTPGPRVLTLSVFDLAGHEVFSVAGYDDATWTPDGKIIATGALYDPGLFEIDPATKQVTPIDAQISSPFQPSVSPDGKTIAFVTGERVWLIGRDGKNLRQLFPDGTKQQRPVFSPDGTKVAAILCNHLGNDTTGDVFVVDIDTREVTQLRTNTGSSLVPDTSTRLNWVP